MVKQLPSSSSLPQEQRLHSRRRRRPASNRSRTVFDIDDICVTAPPETTTTTTATTTMTALSAADIPPPPPSLPPSPPSSSSSTSSSSLTTTLLSLPKQTTAVQAEAETTSTTPNENNFRRLRSSPAFTENSVFTIEDNGVCVEKCPTTTSLSAAATTATAADINANNANINDRLGVAAVCNQSQPQKQVAISPTLTTTKDVCLLSQQQSELPMNNLQSTNPSTMTTDCSNSNKLFVDSFRNDINCYDNKDDLMKDRKGGIGPRTADTFDEIIASRRGTQHQHQKQDNEFIPSSKMRPGNAGAYGKRSDNNDNIITSNNNSSTSTSSIGSKISINNHLDQSIKNQLEEVEIMRVLRNQIEQQRECRPPTVSSDDDHDEDDTVQDSAEKAIIIATNNKSDDSDNNEVDEEEEEDDNHNNDDNDKDDNNNDDDDEEQNFEEIATVSEERYVMRQLLQKVEAAEDVDYYTEMYPLAMTTTATLTATATAVTNIITDRTTMLTVNRKEHEESQHKGVSLNINRMPLQQQRLRLPWGITSSKIAGGGEVPNDEATLPQSKVTEIIEIQRRRIRQRIPKWIPEESGRYFCNVTTCNDLLFTRSQFMSDVVVQVEKQIDGLRHDQTWKVTLSSSNCNHDDDPYYDSYLLEAEGTEEALTLLRDETQKFVRTEIERVNLKRLVEDDESLIVDVSLDIAKESFDSRFSTRHVTSKGVYIKAIDPNGALARDLGSKEAYERGCAVFKVNDREIANTTELEEIQSLAKVRCGDRSRSSSIIKLTLCLSKYADLSDAPNFSRLNIRKRDGRSYKAEVYENYRLHRVMEFFSPQKEESSNHQTIDDNVTVDYEEQNEQEQEVSCSSTVIGKTKLKRKGQRAGKSDERKAKRKKTIRKDVESDSDTDIDTFGDVVDDGDGTTDNKNGETEKGKRTANDGIKRFWQFEKKFRPLLNYDYKDTKIMVKKSCSSIWSAHKSLFGDDAICGDDCECFLRLSELTVNVIKDHIAQQKKKEVHVETEEELEGRTCGIIKYFAPRFFPRLKKEYPTETHNQLINRLVDMWPFHQKNRMYGVRCTEGCECEHEWDQIFGRGDKAKAKEFAESTKKKRSQKKRPPSQVCQEKLSTSGSVIPRKKKKASATLLHANPILNEGGEKWKTSSREQNCSIKGNKKQKRLSGLNSNMNTVSRDPFEVVFDTSIELGGRFITELQPNGGRRCRVCSKYANGQLAKDQRISRGTTVVSVITGNTTVNKIKSHDELKQFYDIAKRSRKNVCIIFENQSATTPGTAHNNIKNDDGWNGGALANTNGNSPTMLRRESKTSVSPSQTSTQDLPEWAVIISTTEPGHNKRAPKKSLIRSNETKNKNTEKVVFSIPDNEQFYFLKDEASNVRRVKTHTETSQRQQTCPQISPEEILIDAIRNKSCKDVIKALEKGAIQDLKSVESVLLVQYTFVGNEVKRIDKLAGSANAIEQKNDLNAKYTVLKIYINCIHLIEKTMSLKKWYSIDIKMDHIDLKQTQTINGMIGGTVAMKIRNGQDKEDLGPLPFRKFAQHLSYNDSDIDTPLVYTISNNSNYVFEQRDFVIDLEKDSLPDPVPTGRLGSFTFVLNDIEKQCLSDGNLIEYTQVLSTSSGYLSSGTASITANKRSADKEYIMIKKTGVLKKLNTQLDYIKRFNTDPSTPSDARCLTANISGIDGKSILHAAIQLVDDKDLVEKMLRLGADPRKNSRNSGIGTPLGLAQKNYHSAIEKEKNIENAKKIIIGDIELQRKRCDQARMLVEILQNNVIDPSTVSGIAKSSAISSTAVIPRRRSDIEYDADSLSGNASVPQQSDYVSSHISRSGGKRRECYYCGSRDHSKKQCEVYKNEKRLLFCSHCENIGHDNETCLKLHPELRYITGGVRQMNKFGNGHADALSSASVPPHPILPCLSPKTWVNFNRNWKRCIDGNACRFFKTRRCRFWHDAFLPLTGEKIPTIPPWDQFPVLGENAVNFKSVLVGSDAWWTAAHIDQSSKIVVYTQDLLKCGYVGKDHTAWFRTKSEALDNLRYTVFIRQCQWRPHISQRRFSHNQQRHDQHQDQHYNHHRHHNQNHHYGPPVRR